MALVEEQLSDLYRNESRRILATLIRLLGDIDRAEEALQEAFRAALEQWPRDGVPQKPVQWLISAGRFRVIDAMRRRARGNELLAAVAAGEEEIHLDPAPWEIDVIPDDQLRLIFACCHPVLPREAKIALALREVCGLTTQEVASSFLVEPQAMKRRITRAKERLRSEGARFQIPAREELAQRLDAVLEVIYLIYSEGYSATTGEARIRRNLTENALYLARLVVDLLPEPEAIGLLALILFQESRRETRVDRNGDLVPLEEQDRSRWNKALINEANALVQRAIMSGHFGAYTLQAAITALHAIAPSVAETDWTHIVQLYDMLYQANPTPVVELNRAIAVAMQDGPEAGLAIIDSLVKRGSLARYHLLYAAHADLNVRLGRVQEALTSYYQALELTSQTAERRYIQKKIAEISH